VSESATERDSYFRDIEWKKAIFRLDGNALVNQGIYGVVLTRLDRVEDGNFGDCAPVGSGVHELRIDFGPGYRVYFGEDGEFVILLGGGKKRTRGRDIETAKERWKE
jgi:putative addiction module killer protein